MAEKILSTDTELLLQVLSTIAPLGQALRDDLLRILRTEGFSKKHLLLKEGQVARRIYFIRKGFARSFYIDSDGKEHTLWFNGMTDVMISVYSFFMQQPALENIELLEDSLLQSVTFEELQGLYTDHPAFNLHGRRLTEKYYIRSEEKAMMLHCTRPLARYQSLLKTYPQILQQASLTQIASYLGITLETLSRLRANKHI